MIEDWIDGLQDVWAGIQGDGFKTVHAPYMFKRAEFPSSIEASDLLTNPIALSIAGQSEFEYSLGGQNTGFYEGVTEFHVAPSLDKGLIPQLLQWKGLIVIAAAANMKLGGLVHNFVLQKRPDQITGPIGLQYGDEAEHWGFLVYWELKEIVNSAITVATGE